MAWIELHQGIFRHRKVFALADSLGVHRLQAGAHVISLWLWALENAPSGDLSGLSAKVIAFGAEWDGDAILFQQALVEAGLADHTETGVALHDWYTYAGRLLEKRKAEADRVRSWRAQQKQGEPSKEGERTPYETRTLHATPPHPTVPISLQGGSAESTNEGGEWTGLTPAAAYEKGSARPITPLDAELLTGLVVEFGDQAVIDAIKTAVGGGNWRGGTTYIERILQRWAREGRNNKKPTKKEPYDMGKLSPDEYLATRRNFTNYGGTG